MCIVRDLEKVLTDLEWSKEVHISLQKTLQQAMLQQSGETPQHNLMKKEVASVSQQQEVSKPQEAHELNLLKLQEP